MQRASLVASASPRRLDLASRPSEVTVINKARAHRVLALAGDNTARIVPLRRPLRFAKFHGDLAGNPGSKLSVRWPGSSINKILNPTL
jgi:hypothetical protein